MSASLSERLAEQIRSAGPLTFADFMRAALYDPGEGFFVTNPVGRHFATSPVVSPVFASCVAWLLLEARTALSAKEFAFVEGGPADAALARLVARSAPGLAEQLDYRGVEQDPTARGAAEADPPAFRSAQMLDDFGDVPPFEGVFLANELFDNVPFHRLVRRKGQILEIRIGLESGRFVALEAVADQAAIAAASRPPDEGEEVVSSPESRRLFARACERLRAGYAVVIDYGPMPGERFEAVRAYRAHRMLEDPLDAPGTADITGPVDFGALADEAMGAGLVVELTTQRELLLRAGYRGFVEDLAARQHEAEGRGAHTEALAYFNARNEAAILVARDQLGGHTVLIARTLSLPPLGAAASGEASVKDAQEAREGD